MAKETIKTHAIQLVDIYPLKLFIEAIGLPDRNNGIGPTDVDIQIGLSEINENEGIANIFISVDVKSKDETKKELPLKLDIELTGLFKIDTKNFNKDQIEDWAHRGSMYILLPYVREYVYWLTYRCGFKPLILPLAQIPTIRYRELGEGKNNE
jgi:preprotein translocase subunit SecB